MEELEAYLDLLEKEKSIAEEYGNLLVQIATEFNEAGIQKMLFGLDGRLYELERKNVFTITHKSDLIGEPPQVTSDKISQLATEAIELMHRKESYCRTRKNLISFIVDIFFWHHKDSDSTGEISIINGEKLITFKKKKEYGYGSSWWDHEIHIETQSVYGPETQK
jgi:hypothetical protein